MPFSQSHFSFTDILLDAGQEPSTDVGLIESGGNKYKQIFALRAVPLLIIFALIYIGVEVTLGGQRYQF